MNNDKYVYGIKCWEKFPDVTVSIETITPDVAIAMLERNVNNRKIKDISRLVGEILAGEWKLNGATIVFDKDGMLVDGQHRLESCVKSNTPITSIIVRGIDNATQITMDAGYKRSVQDFLKMLGYKDVSLVGAMGVSLFKKDTYGIKSAVFYNGKTIPSTRKAVEFINDNYDSRIKPILRKVAHARKNFKGVPITVWTPLFDEFRSISAEDFEHFYGMLMGEYTPTNSMMKLINRLYKLSSEKRDRLPFEYVAAYIIKAWNAYINGTNIEVLSYRPGGKNPEPFPEISHGIDRDESERDAA